MTPVFGFSAGDFIAAIGLTVKISKALRETGGASTECSLLIQDLHNLQQILELLQQLRPAGGNLSHVNAIRGVAITCLSPLKDFAEKIEMSYGSISGSRPPRRPLYQTGRKIQWGLFGRGEVSKFRADIITKVSSVVLLLGILNNESLSRIEHQNQDATKSLLTEAAEFRGSLGRDLSRLAIQQHDALSASISGAQKEIRGDLSNFENNANARYEGILGKADLTIGKLDALNHIIEVQHDAYVNMRETFSLCFGANAGTEQMLRSARRKLQKLERTMKSLQKEKEQTKFRIPPVFDAVLNMLQFLFVVGASLLSILIPLSEKVLRWMRKNMNMNVEIFASLLKSPHFMPNQIMASDVFHFEDVLGRIHKLEHVHFRYWEVFESMLHCHFRGLPGEEKVSQGQYLIMNGSLPGVVVDEAHWQQTIIPGMRLKMSVIIQDLRVTHGFCPRPQCGGVVETRRLKMAHCLLCGLYFVPLVRFSMHSLDESEIQDIPLLVRKERNMGSAMLNEPKLTKKTGSTELLDMSDAGLTQVQKRLEQFEIKAREQAERERQEVMVFRMVHFLGSLFNTSHTKPLFRRVEGTSGLNSKDGIGIQLPEIEKSLWAIMYSQRVKLEAEGFHKNTYLTKLVSIISQFIQAFMNFYLAHASQLLKSRSSTKKDFEMAFLAEFAYLWREFNQILTRTSNVLSHMERIYCGESHLPGVLQHGHRAFHCSRVQPNHVEIRRRIESISKAGRYTNYFKLWACLDTLNILDGSCDDSKSVVGDDYPIIIRDPRSCRRD